jgi:hypothetical protein
MHGLRAAMQAIAQFAGSGNGNASFAFGALKPWQVQLLEKLHLSGPQARKVVHLRAGQQPVDGRLLGAVRVMLLQDRALVKGKSVDELCAWDRPLSKAHEVGAAAGAGAALCCAVLCCAVLCCAVLCCAVLCCAVSRQQGTRDSRHVQACCCMCLHCLSLLVRQCLPRCGFSSSAAL